MFSYLISGSLCCVASLCLSLMGLLFGGQTKVLRKKKKKVGTRLIFILGGLKKGLESLEAFLIESSQCNP